MSDEDDDDDNAFCVKCWFALYIFSSFLVLC